VSFRLFRRPLALLAAAAMISAVPAGAASQKELQPVRGEVGVAPTKDGAFKRVFGKSLVADDTYAVTHAASNGLVLLEDSSQVALGPNTSVLFGRLNVAGNGSTIVLDGGTMRFDVKHPAGVASNYTFRTATSQIAVRGTLGLYGRDANGDTISCLQCDPGDVTVTAGGKDYPLTTGQTLFVSLLGIVTAGATTAAVLHSFASSGLSTSATSQTAFSSGAGAGGGAAAGAAGVAAPVGVTAGLAAAAAIAGAAMVTSKTGKTQTPIPAASQIPGGVTVKDHRPTPSPTPTPPAPKH